MMSNRLDYFRELVERIQPGQCLRIHMHELCDIPMWHYHGAEFNPADQILEGIVGAAYEYCYRFDSFRNEYVFERLAIPSNDPVYVSPDRRAKQ